MFWVGSPHKKIQLMLEILKAPFLFLHCYYCALMTFVMVSVILLSMLMMLFSILSVFRNLICGKSKTLWTRAGICLLISKLEGLDWFHLAGLIALVLLIWRCIGLFLRVNHLLRNWGWLSLLNWIGDLTLSLLLKLTLSKIGA